MPHKVAVVFSDDFNMGSGESSSGEGVAVRKGTAIASSANSDSLDRAIAEAMENVINDVTKLLTRGFAEPKKKSKTSQR